MTRLSPGLLKDPAQQIRVPRDIELRTLSPAQISSRWREFSAIAADVPGEYWTLENFLRDLPDKWQISFAAWCSKGPMAYAILSRRSAEWAHLHHFVVVADYRNRGLGGIMMREMLQRLKHGCYLRLTLKVHSTNVSAQRFYAERGFRIFERTGDYLVLEKEL